MKILPEEQYKYVKLLLPDGSKAEGHEVLLHACCAPCSSAREAGNPCALRQADRKSTRLNSSHT